MKVLLTGCTGYVGNIIRSHLEKKYNLYCTSMHCLPDESRLPCDLTDQEAVFRLAKYVRPDVIIHSAGNKNIAYCEKNRADAVRINCESVKYLAAAFEKAKIIYISADYVFDGGRGHYGELDRPAPGTVYGISKLCGESEGLKIAKGNFTVLRTSALYDKNATFLRFLREKLSRKETVECYEDAWYSPTYYKDFLDILEKLLMPFDTQDAVFHACGQRTSRYDFAIAFARTHNYDVSQIRKSSCRDSGLFLFPDLSLKNDKTRMLLRVRTTDAVDALTEISKEVL